MVMGAEMIAMNTLNNPPQTVSFIYEILFNRVERTNACKPLSLGPFDSDSFEDMFSEYRKASRARAYRERATGFHYRAKLTPYGRERCRADADCRKRHDAIGYDWQAIGY